MRITLVRMTEDKIYVYYKRWADDWQYIDTWVVEDLRNRGKKDDGRRGVPIGQRKHYPTWDDAIAEARALADG